MTIAPEKLIGKHVNVVVERMRVMNLPYRVVRERGLITADYDPQRYTLMIDEDSNIIDAVLG